MCHFNIEQSINATMQYIDIIRTLVDDDVVIDDDGNIVYYLWKEGEDKPTVVSVPPELAASRVELFTTQLEGTQ